MPSDALAVIVRPAVAADADGITQVYLESAKYHAGLDPERYWVPEPEHIAARYREGRQHAAEAEAVTLVAEAAGAVVGFVDVRLTQSPDPMHREMTYCHIVEIAVSERLQGHGIGAMLLHAAESWGRERGAEFGLLEYLAANSSAAAFYERLGYRPGSINAIKRL